jgi:hypothetical protein
MSGKWLSVVVNLGVAVASMPRSRQHEEQLGVEHLNDSIPWAETMPGAGEVTSIKVVG